MTSEYVEQRESHYFIRNSRVSLDSIVYGFLNGESPETIQSHFPTLSLEQVYGAITFYLGNKEEVERDIIERSREEDEFEKTHPFPPHLEEKLERARQDMLARKG